VMPVGSALSQARRIASSKEDVLFQTNPCDTRIASQEITISDPGGGRTDFTLLPLANGVSISPSAGVTPARVRISYNPLNFRNVKGTATIPIEVLTGVGVTVVPSLTSPTS